MSMIIRSFRILKQLGSIGSVVYIFQHYYQRFLKARYPYKLFSKYARYPLLCRPDTSDINVFGQIFIDREYRCVDDVSNVSLVVDCGANVGYSSAYLLNRFPNCYLIAIEPDLGNYLVMTKNLKPYNNRVLMLNSAIWSHSVPLTMSEQKYRDGKEWTRQVRECRPGEVPLVTAVDIGSILRESKHDRISILKIDIERAEGVIFSSTTYKSWIDKVDIMLIELHDDSSFGKCSDIFFSALEKEDFAFSRCGELIVCKRRQLHQ